VDRFAYQSFMAVNASAVIMNEIWGSVNGILTAALSFLRKEIEGKRKV